MKFLKSILAAAALLAITGPALALPITITGLDNFGNTATGSGASPLTFGPTTIGQWTVQGQALGTPPAPLGTLLSNTISFASTGAGSLTVWVTETGITGLQGLRDFHSSLTSNGFFGPLTANLSTYLQLDNSTPGPIVGTGVLLDSFLFNSIGTQVSDINELIGANPFSLTEKYVVTAGGAGGANLTAQINAVPVPEPSSLAIFGFGLLAVGWYLSRRKTTTPV